MVAAAGRGIIVWFMTQKWKLKRYQKIPRYNDAMVLDFYKKKQLPRPTTICAVFHKYVLYGYLW